MRMLATLIRPDSGDAVLSGSSVMTQPEEVRRKIGYREYLWIILAYVVAVGFIYVVFLYIPFAISNVFVHTI